MEVDDFIETLPKDEKLIVKRLRNLILLTDPRIREKLSYGVPYFFCNRRLCFLWPASALPQPDRSRFKVTLGLCYGNLLSNAQVLLEQNGRKQVFTISFASLADMEDGPISEILKEAVMVDAYYFGKDKSSRKWQSR